MPRGCASTSRPKATTSRSSTLAKPRSLACSAAVTAAYDLVVLDVMLPGKDGFSVVSELREARQFVPVLMLTARGRPEDVLKGFAAGADDYLPKPTELAILMARIGGLLRRSEWARAVHRSVHVRRQDHRLRHARAARRDRACCR